MALVRGRSSAERPSYWPGYVDALSSLLLVIIFLLSLFMIAQFFLNQEILGRDTALSRLNAQIAELTELLQLERANSEELELSISSLSATLAGVEAERDSLQSELAGLGEGISDYDSTIAGLETELSEERELSSEAQAQVALLNQQLAALRQQIGALEAALEASELRDTESRTQIADLGRRLNLALAQRVQDLSRYRSDFFGRLREILEGRSDVQVVGDRFVFQSEVLFDAGQAQISAEGQSQITALADAILELENEIPADIPWVLRIDGHTDRRPISTPQFPSNWELSAARAISVAKLLVEQGVSPNRLLAAGFGEYAPLDPADTEEAYRRNRRIEFKLTEA
ncbi:peptidoglycan -binding protein [Pelagibacterium flavum]|uniref:Peptidoglycan -binding protein n=1 Tax=Pelagibacterium flavum TaxID=2984530 RepID=A0ABY6ITH8_9HYPH|nr:peptidoglycan -binding protein [Pelagibacterium sp. YIM 151497]UYQ73010.1 peptidoglycan -binding protein [Pelagibacterium sp. YIM 151497]|eukprot:jgi/Tetstr1/451571/TSEL_038607.t1